MEFKLKTKQQRLAFIAVVFARTFFLPTMDVKKDMVVNIDVYGWSMLQQIKNVLKQFYSLPEAWLGGQLLLTCVNRT